MRNCHPWSCVTKVTLASAGERMILSARCALENGPVLPAKVFPVGSPASEIGVPNWPRLLRRRCTRNSGETIFWVIGACSEPAPQLFGAQAYGAHRNRNVTFGREGEISPARSGNIILGNYSLITRYIPGEIDSPFLGSLLIDIAAVPAKIDDHVTSGVPIRSNPEFRHARSVAGDRPGVLSRPVRSTIRVYRVAAGRNGGCTGRERLFRLSRKFDVSEKSTASILSYLCV